MISVSKVRNAAVASARSFNTGRDGVGIRFALKIIIYL
ncbi:hypothetical protein KCO_01107 [Pectobacterium brasiliense ICMP 19477]|nr:hypothetical protein KCO_01107 [Pectobacterium brasiliense ICMP 19477]